MNQMNEAGRFRPLAVGDVAARSPASWPISGRCEPRLDELLDDPIMALLWRGDRLEPVAARATVLGLREMLRQRGRQLEPLGA